MKKLIFIFIILFSTTVYAWTFGGNYNKYDTNFNRLAMRVYRSGNPYIYTQGAYTYNAIPITTTMSGCKLISIIRQTVGFPKPAYWAIENYKICNGNIAEVKDSNITGLPNGIKPVINNIVQEARQYGKATADYYGYRIVGKTQAYNNKVYIYVLYGIELQNILTN